MFGDLGHIAAPKGFKNRYAILGRRALPSGRQGFSTQKNRQGGTLGGSV